MKESERLRDEARQEENDLAALGKYNKALREQRSENFEDKWLIKLKEVALVSHYPTMEKYIIEGKDHNIYHYFPKANKVLIQKLNKWKKPGLKFLVKTFSL